ncbi:MAG: TonB-dependent receptor [Mangrovibacterium sp.]
MRKQSFGKFLCTLALVLFVSASAWAQSMVTGTVIDAANGESLVGSTVYLESNSKVGILTDIDGKFELKVPEGEQTLVFSFIGYNTVVKKVAVKGATKLGTIELEPSALGLSEVAVIASYATDRKTPVAISNIPASIITEKLGNQEFPEILKSTPSVYVTKQGGGFGDSRINIRGFNTSNIGVLINGVPVNDMTNGRVYFSNWAGLSDVTSIMQVQRGLGAAKIAISSVGGTMNIITKSADAKKGGSVYYGMGNDGYKKLSFNVSTGLMENGWAITLLGGMTSGDGYVQGTEFSGQNYFVNVSKVINPQHTLSFQVFGAPQWHNQRGSQHTIAQFKNMDAENPYTNPWGTRLNSEAGVRNGKAYNGAYGYNYYHKPQASLNHYWHISTDTKLNTTVYASIASGGGRRMAGDKASEIAYSYNNYTYPTASTQWRTGEGLIDFDKITEHNQAKGGEADFLIGNSVNDHEWFGLLSTLTHNTQNIEYTFGFDSRYYHGEHYMEIEDLLGGQYYTTDWNVNMNPNTPLREGDKYSYWNDEQIIRNGLFAQAEYSKDKISGFASGTVSYQNVRRIDYYQYTPGSQLSDWQNFVDWSIKGGLNYNFTDNHNAFVNAGYFTRTPFQTQIFNGYSNEPAVTQELEKVLTFEAGYGFQTSNFNAKIGAYWTEWRDQGLRKTFNEQSYNVLGINSRHQGIELEATYKPTKDLTIRAMGSLGFWKYIDDVNFKAFDENQILLGEFHAYLDGVSVGNSAQNTAALGINYRFFKDWNIGIDGNYFGKNFADFDPAARTAQSAKGVDSWQMPDAFLVDINLGYNFQIGGLKSRVFGNVNNLFNTEYIADATDGTDHTWRTAGVYYGFGRTFSLGMKVNF